ncbi:MAG: hypothetical protein K0Q51_747 [Rickettsiaceae bacterium]|jgi:uncharacterized protein (TIGR00251 family)|nr:hypothetical protein [Rickettsiaceae bacterium]
MFERYFIQNSADSFKVYLKIKAAAKRDSIEGFQEIDNKFYLKLSVKQRPEQGKANLAIISYISKIFELPKSSFEIIQGATSPLKILLIKKIDSAYLKSKFQPYIS